MELKGTIRHLEKYIFSIDMIVLVKKWRSLPFIQSENILLNVFCEAKPVSFKYMAQGHFILIEKRCEKDVSLSKQAQCLIELMVYLSCAFLTSFMSSKCASEFRKTWIISW